MRTDQPGTDPNSSGPDPVSPTVFETARDIVHAWQCDHMGHANLRAYGEFFEQALWQFFFHLGLTPAALRGDIRMAGVQQNISYRKELIAGDLICVRSRLAEISERKLRMEHELLNVESNEVCATCELTAVCIDAVSRKPRSLPRSVQGRGAELLGGHP